MANVNFSKPSKSRLGQRRRTLCLRTNDTSSYQHNFSLLGQTSGDANANTSNGKRGVNKCLFGNKNPSYQNFDSSETPRSACFNVMENKHIVFDKSRRSNLDEKFKSTLNYCGESYTRSNLRSGNENHMNATNSNNPVTDVKSDSVRKSEWACESFSDKDVMKHQGSTLGQDSKNHISSNIIPFTPIGKEDDFPDLESREKDEKYVWSVFKPKKSNVKAVSPVKNSYNVHRYKKQEHSPPGTTNTIHLTKPSVGPHRFLQYQSGVLQFPTAPTRSFSYKNIKIEEPLPPVLTQSLNANSNANGKQHKQTIATECNFTNNDSPKQIYLNDSFNSDHDSTDSFIENESTLVQLDNINFNDNCKDKVATHLKQDNEDECDQTADSKSSIVTNDAEDIQSPNINKNSSQITLLNGMKNEGYLQPASMLSLLENNVATKLVSPNINKMFKLTPTSATKHSGKVISTKIRRSFINSKTISPNKMLKDLRAKVKLCEDSYVTDCSTESDYFNLANSSKKTRLSPVIEHETDIKSKTVNSAPIKETCESIVNNETTSIEPPECVNRIELHEKELALLSSIMVDIIQRQKKMDTLLNSYLLEKEIVDKQLTILFNNMKKCINEEPGSIKKSLSTTLRDNSAGSLGTPLNLLCNPSPTMSVDSKRKLPKTSARQEYSSLRASYNCLRTPINSQKKKNKRSNCYTPHSLSMCVDEQMKDIFGD